MNEITGCYKCQHLSFYEACFEESEDSGLICDARGDIDTKKLPLKKLCKYSDLKEKIDEI